MKHHSNRKWMAGLALMAVLLTGCSSDGTEDVQTSTAPPADSQEIRFNVDLLQVTEGKMATRATTYSTVSDLQSVGSFACYAYQNTTTNIAKDANSPTPNDLSNLQVNYANGTWSFPSKHLWPTTDTEETQLNFFAHLPYNLENTCCTYTSYTNKNPVITCADLPVTITKGNDNTKELVYAFTAEQTKTAQGASGVTLNFQHPFARICFKLSAASGENVKINSITIPAIYRDGTCTFTGGTTSTWSDHADNTASLVISKGENDTATGDDFYLVIPNSYGTKRLTVNCTWSEWGNEVTADLSKDITINWAAGNSYTYTLTVWEYALKVETTETFTEQW